MVLSAEQQQLINAWLKYSPYIWNLGLEQLHLLERNYARNPKIKIKKEAISEEKKEPVDRSPKSREQEAEQRRETYLEESKIVVYCLNTYIQESSLTANGLLERVEN